VHKVVVKFSGANLPFREKDRFVREGPRVRIPLPPGGRVCCEPDFLDQTARGEVGPTRRSTAHRWQRHRPLGSHFVIMVSNIAVTITGNRAAASAYLLVLISKDGNHRSLPPGRYACELIKEDSGQWRFSRRTVFHDHDYTLDGIGR
jgi:hypothetical protein